MADFLMGNTVRCAGCPEILMEETKESLCIWCLVLKRLRARKARCACGSELGNAMVRCEECQWVSWEARVEESRMVELGATLGDEVATDMLLDEEYDKFVKSVKGKRRVPAKLEDLVFDGVVEGEG